MLFLEKLIGDDELRTLTETNENNSKTIWNVVFQNNFEEFGRRGKQTSLGETFRNFEIRVIRF